MARPCAAWASPHLFIRPHHAVFLNPGQDEIVASVEWLSLLDTCDLDLVRRSSASCRHYCPTATATATAAVTAATTTTAIATTNTIVYINTIATTISPQSCALLDAKGNLMEVVDFNDAKSNCGSVWSSGDVVSINIVAVPPARKRTAHRAPHTAHCAPRTPNDKQQTTNNK
jgi:hypothetical protein